LCRCGTRDATSTTARDGIVDHSLLGRACASLSSPNSNLTLPIGHRVAPLAPTNHPNPPSFPSTPTHWKPRLPARGAKPPSFFRERTIGGEAATLPTDPKNYSSLQLARTQQGMATGAALRARAPRQVARRDHDRHQPLARPSPRYISGRLSPSASTSSLSPPGRSCEEKPRTVGCVWYYYIEERASRKQQQPAMPYTAPRPSPPQHSRIAGCGGAASHGTTSTRRARGSAARRWCRRSRRPWGRSGPWCGASTGRRRTSTSSGAAASWTAATATYDWVESYVVEVPPGNTADETRTFVDTVRCNLQSLARTAEQLADALA
jgi:hypothetical protein